MSQDSQKKEHARHDVCTKNSFVFIAIETNIIALSFFPFSLFFNFVVSCKPSYLDNDSEADCSLTKTKPKLKRELSQTEKRNSVALTTCVNMRSGGVMD